MSGCMKLTRQGVRDLGNDTRRYRPKPHQHFFGPTEVLGHEARWDPDYLDTYCEPIYGQRCIHCGQPRQER